MYTSDKIAFYETAFNGRKLNSRESGPFRPELGWSPRNPEEVWRIVLNGLWSGCDLDAKVRIENRTGRKTEPVQKRRFGLEVVALMGDPANHQTITKDNWTLSGATRVDAVAGPGCRAGG